MTVVLQRFRFPDDPAQAPLYVRPGGAGRCAAGRLTLPPGGAACLDSFRNACVVGRNGWPAAVGEITCTLVLGGAATVRLLARDDQGRERVLASRHVDDTGEAHTVSLTVAADAVADGRLFPAIEAGRTGTVIVSGDYRCPVAPAPVRLAVVICTFRREEALRANLRRLTAAWPAEAAEPMLFVADNGGSVSPDDLPPGCRLVPGPNLGGAGGFSRGMAAALDRGATHIVLLDDDVALDTESIARCQAFFQCRPDGAAVAGVLLDPDRPTRVQEAGAWVSGTPSPLVVRLGGAGLDLDGPEALDRLWRLPGPDYGGFWLLAFPARPARETGLLLPFFLKADDVEFGLRLGRHGAPLTALSGVGLSHPPFTAAFSLAKRTYWVRNMLTVEALDGTRSAGRVARLLWREAVAELRRLRYPQLAALVFGVEGFLRGPKAVVGGDDATLARRLARAGGRFDPPPGLRPPLLPPDAATASPWPSLFGHLLPGARLPAAARPERPGGPVAPWQPAGYTVVDNGFTTTAYPLRRRLGLGLGLRAAWALAGLAVRFGRLRRLWREHARELASPEAWRRRAGPPRKNGPEARPPAEES